MAGKTEDIIDRYLEAVAAQLSPETRDDITAELRELILSRLEAREEALGRAPTGAEVEAVLREIGHPLGVAARYRPGPDSLIGPELFPWWLYGVKAGLLVLGAIHVLSLVITLVSGPRDAGQAIAQAFHSFFGAGLTLIGVLTLAGAIMEHYRIRPRWMTEWRARDLPAFGLSDPLTWGVTAREAMKADDRTGQAWKTTPIRPVRVGGSSPAGEAVFSLLAIGLFVMWWLGLLAFPGLEAMTLGGEAATITAAPIWSALFVPILLYALGQMGVELFTLTNPDAVRLRAVLRIAIAVGGLWLTWTIFQAGHWFTLGADGETARVVGDRALLTIDRVRTLGDGPRDVAGIATTLSVVFTWVAAISAVSMVWSIFANAWRAVRP
jgi:hypothetical protein